MPYAGYGQTVLATSPSTLVGLWKLNEASGTTAHDSSGAGNNATLQVGGSPAYQQTIGPWSGAGAINMSFTSAAPAPGASSSPLSAQTGILYAPGAPVVTVAGWYAATSFNNTSFVILAWDNGAGNIAGRTVVNTKQDTGTFHSALAFPSYTSPISSEFIPVNTNFATWFHLAFVLSATSMLVYVNGSLAATITLSGANAFTSASRLLMFGGDCPASNVSLWTSALTASQIAALAGARNPDPTTAAFSLTAHGRIRLPEFSDAIVLGGAGAISNPEASGSKSLHAVGRISGSQRVPFNLNAYRQIVATIGAWGEYPCDETSGTSADPIAGTIATPATISEPGGYGVPGAFVARDASPSSGTALLFQKAGDQQNGGGA